jgi:hypothetical protein
VVVVDDVVELLLLVVVGEVLVEFVEDERFVAP